METPSSTARRVTRSQAIAMSASNTNNIPISRKIEDSEISLSKSRQRKGQVHQQDRCALIDISNDSPIVGLANGEIETPLSSVAKQRGSRMKKTPGSGEALLRGQVKTLLQKVEEEAEISKLTMDTRPFPQFVNSPMHLLAPTPANTPQIPNINNSVTGFTEFSPSSVVQEQLIPQVVNEGAVGKNEEKNIESEKSVLSPVLLDFSDKSEVTEDSKMGSTEDDGDSIWSIQVNASTHDDEDEDEEITEVEYDDVEDDYYEDVDEEEEHDDGGLLIDELCEGLRNIGVNEKVVPKFAGKHTRFVYGSDDDEIVDEVVEESGGCDSEVLHLKGLPTPKGKHIRFEEEEEN
ncbi:probable ubiquitin fusion degradation protein C12B10.01c [Lathyrus oleraceus]|nr:probable ubiquitin fusion degradation protein C12B10.01c [Pisum sativum]